MRDEQSSAEVLRLVSEIGLAMQAKLPTITDGMGSLLADGVAGIDSDPDLTDMLNASIGGNLSTIFHVLANDIPIAHLQPTTAAVEYARRSAQRGVPGNALRRAYHVGQENLIAAMFTQVQALDCGSRLKLLVFNHMTRVVNEYIDWITQYVLTVYDDERQRWDAASANMTSSLIHSLLENHPVKPATFLAETGYSLEQHHLGVVVWAADEKPGQDEIILITQFVDDLARAGKAAGSPILVALDRSTAWAWLPLASSPGSFDLGAARCFADSTEHCRLGIGLPSTGVAGFVRTHTQAQNVRALAAAMPIRPTAAMSYGDQGVAITALLARDMETTRLWVNEVLGGLAVDTEAHARLRETVQVFLSTGGSYTDAAERLHLHRNSVKYRVVKAMEARGRPLEGDRLDVELALQVCHFLGSTVLASALKS